MEGVILELAVKHLNTGIIRIRRYVYLFSYKSLLQEERNSIVTQGGTKSRNDLIQFTQFLSDRPSWLLPHHQVCQGLGSVSSSSVNIPWSHLNIWRDLSF